MRYKINKTIDFKEYERKYKAFFEKLSDLVNQSYRAKDLKRKKPRNPVEIKILKMLHKQPV